MGFWDSLSDLGSSTWNSVKDVADWAGLDGGFGFDNKFTPGGDSTAMFGNSNFNKDFEGMVDGLGNIFSSSDGVSDMLPGSDKKKGSGGLDYLDLLGAGLGIYGAVQDRNAAKDARADAAFYRKLASQQAADKKADKLAFEQSLESGLMGSGLGTPNLTEEEIARRKAASDAAIADNLAMQG